MMKNNNFSYIEPNSSQIPDTAVIEKVLSDRNKQDAEQHEKAVRAFFIADGIASGIGKDLAFVDKIPSFIKEIIDDKLWECLYVAKGVVTPYYCRYTKGSDSENFRAFITAKRPNGLESSVETLLRVLQADPEVQRKFRDIIYESRQGERTDLSNETSYGDRKKLEDELSQTQKSVMRSASRAAEAIPEIGELLDRGLIAIDVAAKLGRDIKNSENLTAEEREYVDKRDLMGIRIREYINTNTIPEDEDKEPAYKRELNSFVKDLLGIKDRSKTVRMDNPKKAAEKLLKFYQQDKLKELIACLSQGLSANGESDAIVEEYSNRKDNESFNGVESSSVLSSNGVVTNGSIGAGKSNLGFEGLESIAGKDDLDSFTNFEEETTSIPDRATPLVAAIDKAMQNQAARTNSKYPDLELTADGLAERWGVKSNTVGAMWNKYKNTYKFHRWSKKRDPEGMTWERTDRKKGRSWLFIPLQTED